MLLGSGTGGFCVQLPLITFTSKIFTAQLVATMQAGMARWHADESDAAFNRIQLEIAFSLKYS